MTEPENTQRGGILMTRGVSLRLSNISFTIGPDGEFHGSPVTAEVLLHMSPFWLEIAMTHVVAAEQHHAALLAAGGEDSRVGGALEGEFVGGMQAIVAAATALDAFYATVKSNIELPSDLTLVWQRNRTPRYAQLIEVLRRGFSLKPHTAKAWRPMLKQLYRFRGWAVHPSASFSAPVAHPDLTSATEHRFVAFTYENARSAVHIALAITALLSAKPPNDAPKTLAEACKGITNLIAPVCKEWRTRYGRLTDDDELEKRGSDT